VLPPTPAPGFVAPNPANPENVLFPVKVLLALSVGIPAPAKLVDPVPPLAVETTPDTLAAVPVVF